MQNLSVKKHGLNKRVLIMAYVIAALFILSLVKYAGIINKTAGVIAAAEFEDYTPYQYRILIPVIIRGAEYITPGLIKDLWDRHLGGFIDAHYRDYREDLPDVKVDRLSEYGFRIAAYLALTYFVLLLYLLVLRNFIRDLNLFSSVAADLLPLGMIFILPLFFNYTLMFYDYPHLLLFTAGLYFMHKRQWLPFMLVYILGCLNKETIPFLTLIFAVAFFTKLPWKKYLSLIAGQAAFAIAIRAILVSVFQSNPARVADWTLPRNLEHLTTLANYFQFEPIQKGMLLPVYLNVPLPRGLNLPMLAVLIFFIIYGWHRKPEFLRQATCYFPFLFIAAMLFGFMDEFRAYYDVLPIIYLLSILGIKYLYQEKIAFALVKMMGVLDRPAEP